MDKIKSALIPIGKLMHNTGQIDGLPKNPRVIRNADFERVKRNIAAHPAMLEYRDLLVYPQGKRFVVICGNQRLAAMRDLGHKECPCTIIPEGVPAEKLRAFTIKDNLEYGKWDMDELANCWSGILDLAELGVDISAWQVKEQDFNGGGEINVGDFKEEMSLKITLPRQQAEWLKEKMKIVHPQAEKAVLMAIGALSPSEKENDSPEQE